MRNATLAIILLFVTLGCCLWDVCADRNELKTGKNPAAIYITGNEFSRLKPCGCSTGQLGGLSKRAGIFQKTPADRRLITDTGNLLRQADEQGLIKLNVLLQAFNLLNYDILNLIQEDARAMEDAALLETARSMTDKFALDVALKLPSKYVTR